MAMLILILYAWFIYAARITSFQNCPWIYKKFRPRLCIELLKLPWSCWSLRVREEGIKGMIKCILICTGKQTSETAKEQMPLARFSGKHVAIQF